VIPDDLVPADRPWPIVLGVDPGTRVLGYGAVVVAPDGPRLLIGGVLAAPARLPVAARLGRIAEGLDELLGKLRPDVVSLERAYASRNVQSALRIGEARGMILSVTARRAIEIAEYAPSVAKKAVLGHGGASKGQVAAMVATILGAGELDLPEDATDALALALAHVNRMALLAHTRRAPS